MNKHFDSGYMEGDWRLALIIVCTMASLDGTSEQTVPMLSTVAAGLCPIKQRGN